MLKQIWRGRSGYLFILPKFALFIVFVFIPILWSFLVSFQEYRVFDTVWVGLDNFRDAFSDDIFWMAVQNTLRYAVVVMPSTVIIALILASLINLSAAAPKRSSERPFICPPLHLLSSCPWCGVGSFRPDLVWRTTSLHPWGWNPSTGCTALSGPCVR